MNQVLLQPSINQVLPQPLSMPPQPRPLVNTQAFPQAMNNCNVCMLLGVAPTSVKDQPLWKRVCPGELERGELVHIARAIPRWSSLARYLGLSDPDIVAISENHKGDYEEQRYQMLLKWYQQQATPPTRQALVRVIEEEMGTKLAQDIVNIVGDTYKNTLTI